LIVADPALAPTWIDAVVLGLVEGLTEFLPISSTGHLIVAQRILGYGGGEANNAFAVGIQFGAITAILILYWGRLISAARNVARPASGQPNLLWVLAIAALPAVIAGLLFEDWIDAHLFSAHVVAVMLVVGGVLLLLLERHLKTRTASVSAVEDISYRTALLIGLWQCLALIPGTSRSGATIAGALLLGTSRTAAAEFSFLLGLPILFGASIYKLLSSPESLSAEMMTPLLIGTGVAFLAALLVVRPFLAFLRRHDFRVFAYYRIAAGVALFALLALDSISA